MKIRALVLLATFSTRALAADPLVQSIPPGDDKIVVVRQGEKVPFTGQLYDGATALRWANWLQQYRQLVVLNHEHDQQVCQAKLDFDATFLASETKKATTIERDLKDRLVASERARAAAQYEIDHPAWYRSIWFGAAVGIVTTLGVSYVAVQALKK